MYTLSILNAIFSFLNQFNNTPQHKTSRQGLAWLLRAWNVSGSNSVADTGGYDCGDFWACITPGACDGILPQTYCFITYSYP